MLTGIILKIFNFRISKKWLVQIVFWVNTILSIPKVFDIENRAGIDYIAYI